MLGAQTRADGLKAVPFKEFSFSAACKALVICGLCGTTEVVP